MLLVLLLGATEQRMTLCSTPSHHVFIPYYLQCLLLQLGLPSMYTEGRMITLLVVLAAEQYFNLEDLLFWENLEE